MSQIFVTSPPNLRQSFSFDKNGLLVLPPIHVDTEFSAPFDLWAKELGRSPTEAEEIPFDSDGIRRSLSRKVSDTWRRSWANRRSYLSLIGMGDVTDEEGDSEGTEKVRRVRKLRDWSAELCEDDIGEFSRPYKRIYDTPIVWAETEGDIATGRYWRYISPLDS